MRRGSRIVAAITVAVLVALGSAYPVHAPVRHEAVAAAPPAAARPGLTDAPDLYMEAYVTGYNTVRAQTDDTPCIAASGANICGRRDTAACPRIFDLGTVIEINGRKYVCEDRTAPKFRGSFDINCDKDRSCPYEVAGWTMVRIFLE